MFQSNLFMIPIDESILLPMEPLEQHLLDSSKPNIISPILRNLLLHCGESVFNLMNYSEILPEKPIELPENDTTLSQVQIGLSQANIPLLSENIFLPLGVPPFNYEMCHVIENDIHKIQEEIKIKPPKKSKMSIDQIAERIAMSQSEIKEAMPSASTAHDAKSEQDTEHSSTSKKKEKSKNHLKRKEVLEDHNKESKKKKSKKDPLDKESEKTKEQKTFSREKKKSSKKQKSKKVSLLQVKETTEPLVDIKEEKLSKKRKKSVKLFSNDNYLKFEEESNVPNSSLAKQPRKSKPDITDPVYLEPFKYGWIREVVYRSVKKTNVKKADIYYHSPDGKKFRTRKEMSEILSRNDQLTEDNFIYFAIPLGINDCTKEIVRNSFTTSALKQIVYSKKNIRKSQKSFGQPEDFSQKDNVFLNNSEQNSEDTVTENFEDTSVINARFKEESIFDRTSNQAATIKIVAEPILLVSHSDTTNVKCDIKIKESNLTTERTKETEELTNDEYLEIKEKSKKILNDNEIINASDRKCTFNPSVIETSNINCTTENSEIKSLRSIDLVNHLDKEILSSSFNNFIEEIDSNKECELSDTERKLNDYSDDSAVSDYKLELESEEENLEELNSSFSKKVMISKIAEIKNHEEKLFQKSAAKNLIYEKKSKISDLESPSTSLSLMKVNKIGKKKHSLTETETENPITRKTPQNNFYHKRSIDNELKKINNLSTKKESATSEKTKSLIEVDTQNLIIQENSQRKIAYKKNSEVKIPIDSKLDDYVPENLSISLDPMSTIVNDKASSLQNTNCDFTNDNSLSNFEHTSSIDITIKESNSDKLLVPESTLILSKVEKVNEADEKINSIQIMNTKDSNTEKKSQDNFDQTSSSDSAMEISSFLSYTALSTTANVTRADCLTVSSDSTISVSQSSNSTEFASFSMNVPTKTDIESKISNIIETSLGSLIFTTDTVTEGKTISSSETLPKKVTECVVQTSKAKNIEKIIGMADVKDSFCNDKTSLVGCIKKVDQELYNFSESLYIDSIDNTYLVNTEGNSFSFTASFEQNKQLLPNTEISVSKFKEDINCLKTIAESIKTLSLPSDLTNKPYFLGSPEALTNESIKNKNSNEIQSDNNTLNNVNQISLQEENFDEKSHISCLKDNISKTETSNCNQIVKSPSINISHSKNFWLELNNSIINKNKNLISKLNENSDERKMNHLNESELSNSNEIRHPMCSNTCTGLEDTVRSTVSKREYDSAESNLQEFVIESYEYKNSFRDKGDKKFENLNESIDSLDDTVSTVSDSNTLLESSMENNDNRATNNLSDPNSQKLTFVNQAVVEGQYSFECSLDTIIELNKLLETSNENDSNTSNSPVTPEIIPIKYANQSTPLSSSKHENRKINIQSRLVHPHSMASFCAGYSALKHIFKYLNFEDLLIAMGVCTVWKEIAQQLHLWKKIRIKNSQLTYSLAKILQNYETKHLLVVEEDSNDWKNFINVLPEIKSLYAIELCPCPAVVFEEIVKNCPQLKIVNALSLKDENINVESIRNLNDPEKLHIRGISSMIMQGDLSFLSRFLKLTHLCLRSIKDLGKKKINVLQSLQNLQSLELGECSEFTNTFGSTTLIRLKHLKHLRLEKVKGSDCCTDILISISKMEKLTELELVNIEVSRSFLNCLPKCQNIKKLLVIPMYKKRIAFSNNIIIKSTTRLNKLVRLVWGIPEDFVQHSKSFCSRPYDDCISVLKPVPFQIILDNIEPDIINTTSEMNNLIKMLPVHILKKLYTRVLPNIQIDILKIPAYANCNLSIA